MVLVEDVTNNQQQSSSQQQQQQSSSTNASGDQNSGSVNQIPLSQFIMQDKISFILWCTRLFTILCSFLFIFPLTSYDPLTLYHKALLGSAATSALKLHQRLQGERFEFSRAYLRRLTIEDSFHYLMYSIIFSNSYPITIVLVPVVLFALLHVSSYTKTMLERVANPNSLTVVRKSVQYLITRDKDIMRFAAINEILLMPAVIFMIFGGKTGIFVPFVYYRFICLRYQSVRNPYNRLAFQELRLTTEYFINQPRCPLMIRNLAQKTIAFICRLQPQQ